MDPTLFYKKRVLRHNRFKNTTHFFPAYIDQFTPSAQGQNMLNTCINQTNLTAGSIPLYSTLHTSNTEMVHFCFLKVQLCQIRKFMPAEKKKKKKVMH